MATDFTLFPKLITELRLEIWRLALPTPIPRLLYPYKKGCWVWEDFGLEPDPNGEDLYLRFDTILLEPLRIQLPLYSVNREARNVTLEYLQKHKATVSRISRAAFEILRPFDARSDIMFLPTADIEAFVMEPIDRLHEPDLLGRHVGSSDPALPRLAVTTEGFDCFRKDGALLEDFFRFGGTIHTICVVETACPGGGKSRELENEREKLELWDEPLARLRWSNVRCEWEGSRGANSDEEALVRLKHYVGGLDVSEYSPEYFELEMQLVHLAMPHVEI